MNVTSCGRNVVTHGQRSDQGGFKCTCTCEILLSMLSLGPGAIFVVASWGHARGQLEEAPALLTSLVFFLSFIHARGTPPSWSDTQNKDN